VLLPLLKNVRIQTIASQSPGFDASRAERDVVAEGCERRVESLGDVL
jgi:hypothetical protein